jgi:tetratricopeptide (TPR) repeat protein
MEPFDAAVGERVLELARRAGDTVLTGRYAPVGAEIAAHAVEVEPAIRGYLDAGSVEPALEIVGSLWFFWEETGRIDEGRRLAALALDAAMAPEASLEHALVGRAMLTAAELAFRQGDQAEAERWNRQAIESATAGGDARTAASAEVGMARIAFRDGNADGIEMWARRGLSRAPDDPMARRGAYHMLAWAAHSRGDRRGAIDWFGRSLEVRRAMEDPFGVAVELANLGDMATEDGDLAAAARYLFESLTISSEINNLYLLPADIGSIGALAIHAGRVEMGCELIGAARAIYRAVHLEPDPSTDAALDDAVTLAEGEIGPDSVRDVLERGTRLDLEMATRTARELAGMIARP